MLIEGACTASQLSCVIAHLFADLEPPCGRCRENAIVVQGITVQSWRAHASKGNCYYLIQKMDHHYHKLFKEGGKQ